MLNPLYLLPLCRFSLFHDTMKPLVLVPERGKGVCLFASPHTCALISTAGPWLKKKHLRHIYHQLWCLLEQTREILYIIPFVLAFTICWLDPLRHLSSSRSAGSRRDTSSFGGETFFPRNLQGGSETKKSWPAPGCGAKWILAMLHLTDTESGQEQIQSVCLLPADSHHCCLQDSSCLWCGIFLIIKVKNFILHKNALLCMESGRKCCF